MKSQTDLRGHKARIPNGKPPPRAKMAIWGWTLTVHTDALRRVVRCFCSDGAFCGSHRHHYQSNHFIVEMGKLQLIAGDQVHWLDPGNSFSVPALATHSFRGLADVSFLQVYVGENGAKPREDDIEKFTDGGASDEPT